MLPKRPSNHGRAAGCGAGMRCGGRRLLDPYRLTRLTLAINPLKVYQYLAAGKPVVTTRLPVLIPFGEAIACAADADEFVDAIEAGLARSGTPVSNEGARSTFASSTGPSWRRAGWACSPCPRRRCLASRYSGGPSSQPRHNCPGRSVLACAPLGGAGVYVCCCRCARGTALAYLGGLSPAEHCETK